MGRRRKRETRVGSNTLGDVDRSMLPTDSDGDQQTKVMRKRESSGQGGKAWKRRKLKAKNCKLLSPNSVQVKEHVLEKGFEASLQVDQNCLSSRNSLDIVGINSAVKDNSFLTNPTAEENNALLSGNTVGIMNQRDTSQSLESNHKHLEVYSRRSRKSGQKGKKNPHNSSDWTLWDTGFHNKNSSTEESTQTGFGRKKNRDASSGVGSLAVDGKQDGYSKEKTQADFASKVSTDTNSNFNEVTTINSETKGKTKRRGKKRKKKTETYIHDNLKPVSEKSVNMSVKSEKNGLEMGDLNSEILTKSEMRDKNNISQTRSVEEENNSLQRRSTVDAANKSVPPHPLEPNLKTSKSKLKYTRRKKKKNETSICSNQVLMSEKEGSGSMKSEITDSVDRVDLYPEICSNSEKETAKPHLEKEQARKRDGAKKKVRTISEDNGLNNDELCHVSPVLAECTNGTLSQLQKYGTFTEEKSSNKDKETSHCSLVKNVTDDSTIIGNLTLDNMPMKLQRTSISCSKRKLLILDLNGLLVDVVKEYRNFRAPLRVAGKSVFKRPFCDEFLEFCLERFDVGIWSSRKKENMNAIINFLFGEKRSQLLFCWSQSQCTFTGFKTIENAHKPLVLKELKRLWNEDHNLPWEKGDYLPSNTLLIDDSPYKALCNPPHTAIFPSPYSCRNVDDNCLGLEGDLRVYLRGIAMADDVQSYIKEHPFGQQAIMPGNPSWGFYLQIIERMNPSFTY